MTWYVMQGGEVRGPLDSPQLKEMAARGQINPQTQVSQSERGPWVAAQKVKGLFPSVSSVSAAPNTVHDNAAYKSGQQIGRFREAFTSRDDAAYRFGQQIGQHGENVEIVIRRYSVPLLCIALAVTVASNFGPALLRSLILSTREVFYVFDQREVQDQYNLSTAEMAKIQVWNQGEIDLVADETREQKQSGKVVDGKVTASEAEIVFRQPVKIPHRTPGVLVESSGGCWIDFGSVVVEFDQRRNFAGSPAIDVLFDRRVGALDGEVGTAKGANISTANCINDTVVVRVMDENGEVKHEWWCKPRVGSYGDDQPFLIYRGGLKESTRRVEELEEKRAKGKRVGEPK